MTPPDEYRAARELLARLLEAKRAHRRDVAALPPEEKFRIIIRMQRRMNEIRRATGRPLGVEWPED